jgi:hypothetical protein
MRCKGQQRVNSLEKEYRDLKDSYPEKVTAIENKWQVEMDKGVDPVVVALGRSGELRTLDDQLSEAKNAWLSARTECVRVRAKTLSVPLPPDTDSDAWQKIGNSLELTDQGFSKAKNAIYKEERERFATWRSIIALIVSIIAFFLSAAAYRHTLQKDTQPSAETGNKTAPAGQPSSGAAKHK